MVANESQQVYLNKCCKALFCAGWVSLGIGVRGVFMISPCV